MRCASHVVVQDSRVPDVALMQKIMEAWQSLNTDKPFLTEAQKRDILYNAATRFLRLKQPSD